LADDPSLEIEAASPVQLEPFRQHLTAWQQRWLALLEVLLCSSLPTQVLIANILGAIGIAPRIGDQLSLTFVFALSLTDTVVLIALMVALTRAHGDSPWLLWRGRPPLAGEILVGLMLVPVAVFIVAFLIGIIRTFVPGLHNVVENPLEALATGGAGGAAMFAVVAIVAGGIREELQRAFLLRRFERHLGGETIGVIVLSTAFGLGHALQGWDAAIATGVLGAFWAILYLRRRSSVAPIVSHAGFNSIEVFRVAMGGGA
jgi:membrane protease YdiL (CAAX protease family)